ncbi:hypothetical protein JCM10296v2_006931 [Rhodotorula toruloides]
MSDSLALLLPDEVWLAILGSLGYMTFVARGGSTRGSTSSFRCDPKFDFALFRKSPVPASESEIEYKLHPVLDEFGLCARMTRQRATLLHWHRESTVDDEVSAACGLRFEEIPASNLYDFPVCDEFATAPATTRFRVFYDHHVLADVAHDAGVTVRQVLFAYADFWAKPVEPYLEEKYRRMHELPEDAYVGKDSALSIKFLDWRPLKYSNNDVRLEAGLPWDGFAERFEAHREEFAAIFARGNPSPDSPPRGGSTDSALEKDSDEE